MVNVVVADDATVSQVVAHHLEREAYRVDTVTHGLEAIRRAEQQWPDLVVLDLMLPGVDGLGSAAGDVRHVFASPQRAREVLGFSAVVSFENGCASARGRRRGATRRPTARDDVAVTVRTRSATAALVLGASLVLPACGGDGAGETAAAPDLVARGEELYAQSCASCHGADLRGTDRGPSHLSEVYRPDHHADAAFVLAAGERPD